MECQEVCKHTHKHTRTHARMHTSALRLEAAIFTDGCFSTRRASRSITPAIQMEHSRRNDQTGKYYLQNPLFPSITAAPADIPIWTGLTWAAWGCHEAGPTRPHYHSTYYFWNKKTPFQKILYPPPRDCYWWQLTALKTCLFLGNLNLHKWMKEWSFTELFCLLKGKLTEPSVF